MTLSGVLSAAVMTATNNAGCLNSNGSYSCDCNAGYNGDGLICGGVNDCSGDNTSSDNTSCNNTKGGYDCNRKTNSLAAIMDVLTSTNVITVPMHLIKTILARTMLVHVLATFELGISVMVSSA